MQNWKHLYKLKMYKYTLQKEYIFKSDLLLDMYFYNDWLVICDGVLRVSKGYSWDGCTFAPDFKSTYHASLIHDAMYQFKQPRKIADELFLEQMKRDNFFLSFFYYFSVRLFGSFFY